MYGICSGIDADRMVDKLGGLESRTISDKKQGGNYYDARENERTHD